MRSSLLLPGVYVRSRHPQGAAYAWHAWLGGLVGTEGLQHLHALLLWVQCTDCSSHWYQGRQQRVARCHKVWQPTATAASW